MQLLGKNSLRGHVLCAPIDGRSGPVGAHPEGALLERGGLSAVLPPTTIHDRLPLRRGFGAGVAATSQFACEMHRAPHGLGQWRCFREQGAAGKETAR
jgi:hypothetical protein